MLERFESFVITINQIYRNIQKLKTREMTEMDLKGTDVMCLFHLGNHEEGLTSAELTALCVEDKAAISRSVASLINKGLVTYADSDGKRKYRAKLLLSPKGKEISSRMMLLIGGAVNKVGDGLTDEEREIFYKALTLISHNLQNIIENGEKLSYESDEKNLLQSISDCF